MTELEESNKIVKELQNGVFSPVSLLIFAYHKYKKDSPLFGWIFIITTILSFTFSFGLMYLGY